MTCSQASTALGEPLAGTATQTSFWLVIEQPGAYSGREGLLSSGFPADAGAALNSAVKAAGGKVALVRSPGRHPHREVRSRRVWLVSGYPNTARVADFDDPWEIRDWIENPGSRGTVQSDPVLLVCGHAKRDVCCARAARALLADAQPGFQTWESSHLGGHRFAPVVLELTTGYMHGRVGPSELHRIGAAASEGRVFLPTARGHFALSDAEQAAELAVLSTGATGPFTFIASGDRIEVVGANSTHDAIISRIAIGSRAESCGASPKPGFTYRVALSGSADGHGLE